VVRPGKLFVVATPIGNLGDFSFRGVEVLRQVSVVAAEDTRQTRKLLARYGVSARLQSLHAHSPQGAVRRLLDRVEAGEDAAYVTDAGTPTVSDPGGGVVDEAHRRGIAVVPVPGPAALLAALSAAGLPADRFVFAGFPPRRGSGRRELLERVAAETWTTVLYESPGRTAALLGDLAEQCGEGRLAVVARELTKLHEDIRRGTLGELAAYYREHPARGEVTVVVSGNASGPPKAVDRSGAAGLAADLRSRLPPAAAARELASRLGVSRREAYRMVTEGRRPDDREAE
jgi:16S rRNA (cytidine1402-2'-O)-methyltransferase